MLGICKKIIVSITHFLVVERTYSIYNIIFVLYINTNIKLK